MDCKDESERDRIVPFFTRPMANQTYTRADGTIWYDLLKLPAQDASKIELAATDADHTSPQSRHRPQL